MRLTGRLLQVEDYAGDFKGESGDVIAYSGKRLHVLDGIEVIKVKVPKAQLLTHGLVAGQEIDIQVTVAAQSGARGAYLTCVLVGSVEPSARLTAVAKAN